MRRNNRYIYFLSFLLFTAALVANRLSFYKMQSYAERVDHTRTVIQTYQQIEDNFKSAQIFSPRHYNGTTKAFYDSYRTDALELNADLNKLKALVADNASQEKRADTLKAAIERHVPNLMRMSIGDMVDAGKTDDLSSILQVHLIIDRGIKEEERLLKERNASFVHFTRLTDLLSLTLAVIAIALIVSTSFSNMRLSSKGRWLEGFLDSILNTSQNGVVYFKVVKEKGVVKDFVVNYSNSFVSTLFPVNAGDIIGKPVSEAFPFIQPGLLWQHLADVQNTGRSVEFEMLYDFKGQRKWVTVALTKLSDGVTGSFHNISQIKQYEKELQEKIVQLEHSNGELEQYAYVASHDLQEPLRKIRTFGSLLRDTQAENLDAKGKTQLEKILASTDRMSALIKDILNFSSLKKDHDYQQVDLKKTLQTALEDLNLVISQKRAIIKYDQLPVIEAIPLQMTQLFYNLLNNSLKFTKADLDPVIEIRCRVLSDEEKLSTPGLAFGGVYYMIDFSDNGIGFNQHNADQIFGMFKRLADRNTYAGSGIGLALCRKVAENHHGYIRAEATEGKGATFHVILPEKQAASQQ